jgi:DNA-binding HxlR family transcriptional regulator
MSAVNVNHKAEEMCSIARTLEIVGDKWTFLILREAALRKVTRFADFRDGLRIAPDVLSNRLNILVDAEVMEKQPYREPGTRTRYSYHLTPAGEQLLLVLAALQQWGDENRPPTSGPSTLRRSADHGRPVRVAFVDDTDAVIPAGSVLFTPAAPAPVLNPRPRPRTWTFPRSG